MFTQEDTATSEQISDDDTLSLEELTEIMHEIEEQPHWRHIADKEMDYADGNQLDTDLLNRMQQIGIPPAVEDRISPALLSIMGYELQTRTDWRVKANGETGGDDVADNLICLCYKCHRMAHDGNIKKERLIEIARRRNGRA